MDHARAAEWLDGYVAAWQSNEPEDIAALFTVDAQYRYSPWREPVEGVEAIVAAWQKDFDPPDTWRARYEPLAVDGDLVIATGETEYLEEGHTYSNMFVLRFGDEGRCREFTDWHMRHPKPQ